VETTNKKQSAQDQTGLISDGTHFYYGPTAKLRERSSKPIHLMVPLLDQMYDILICDIDICRD
jgi:hypothetical protein